MLYVDCLRAKYSSKEIPKRIGVHPFVINKHSKYHARIVEKADALYGFLRGLLALEHAIKTGKQSDGVFWLQLKQLLIGLHR